jgi:hypothetical protein
MVAMGEWEEVEWALVMYGVFHGACSMARRMHLRSYSGFAMLVPCHVCWALLPLNEKTT